jgi:hypothetical protein
VLVTVPAVLTSPAITEWQPVAFGIGAALLAQADNGLVGVVRGFDVAARAAASRGRLESRRALERYARLTHPQPAEGTVSS